MQMVFILIQTYNCKIWSYDTFHVDVTTSSFCFLTMLRKFLKVKLRPASQWRVNVSLLLYISLAVAWLNIHIIIYMTNVKHRSRVIISGP